MPGSGTMTPVIPGAGSGLGLAQPLPRTLLSLPRYAQILGINPVLFQGAVGQTVFPLEGNRCSDVWPRYSWQLSDQIAHEDLAFAILQAEDELTRVLGYPPAPMWFTQEVKQFSQFHRPDLVGGYGRDVRGYRKSVEAKHAKVINVGRRTVTLIGTPTTGGGGLVYSDEDSDGFAETATISIATTVTQACDLKVYFTGTSGAEEWEIRPARSAVISGGIATLIFDSWLFIDPELQSAAPSTDGYMAVDVTTTTNYVGSVDVYREFTDTTTVSSQFFWEPEITIPILCSNCGGVGCIACAHTSQDGCLFIRDVDNGTVVPTPATYDATNAQWIADTFSVGRDPDVVKIWYQAGAIDDRFLGGSSCDPLSDFFARVIAWIATARIERPFCQCGNVTALTDSWREELTRQGETAHLFDFSLLKAPFGTRRGELMAWKAISMLDQRHISTGVI